MNLVDSVCLRLRNWHNRELFGLLDQYCSGTVLDIGGWNFFNYAREKRISFRRWISLDISRHNLVNCDAAHYHQLIGDGCHLPVASETVDTVLAIQVLEHVFDPILVVQEAARALKPGGVGILLLPQTSTLHGIPHHYYNFTKYWIRTAMERAGLEMVVLRPMGGFFSSIASRLIYFFLQSNRYPSMSDREEKRKGAFYLLYPFMVIFALLSIPVCLLFSLGDLTEEPNNHLAVVRKKPDTAGASQFKPDA